MPWKLQNDGDKILVVNKQTGKVMGRHDSKAKARRQLRALYASEPGAKSYSNLFSSIAQRTISLKGGAGSGNFDHQGRPGEIGGSGGGDFNAGDRPSKQEIKDAISGMKEEMDAINEQSFNKEPDSDTIGEYASYDAIIHILRDQQKADLNPDLGKDSLFLYKMNREYDEGDVRAALRAGIKEGKLEINWVGSIIPGEGKKLINKAITWGKEKGAKEVIGTAKYNSFWYWKKKYNAVATGKDPSEDIFGTKPSLEAFPVDFKFDIK
jgi:hypothetical protein